MSSLNDLFAGGYQPAGIAAQIGRRLRGQLIDGDTVIPQDSCASLLEKLIAVPVSHDPERYLEIALLNAMPDSAVPRQCKGAGAGARTRDPEFQAHPRR